MSAIDKSADRQRAVPVLDPQAKIAPGADVMPGPAGPVPPSTYLRHLRRVVRRPLELRALKSGILGAASPLSALFTPEIQSIATTETSDFAFSVAELAFRLEQGLDEILDPEAREGLAHLSEMARMYEHIFILEAEG